MDERTISMLETSFAEFAREREDAAALFYERLFVLDPALRPMFANADMREQKIKLMAALGLVVGKLRALDEVVPVLETLAVKHVAYGAANRHYETVGTALIQTLSLTFGSGFTPELREAWIRAYGLVSGVMMAAADRAEMRGAAAEYAP